MIHPIRHMAALAGLACSFIIFTPCATPHAQAQETLSPTTVDTIQQNVTITGGVLKPYSHGPNHTLDRAAGYFTIHNASTLDLLIQGITSPLCQTVTSNHNSQEMMQISGENDDIFQHFAIPHQATLVFPEEGYHLICRGMKRQPQAGEDIPFTFHFMSGATITSLFKVQNLVSHKP